MAYWEYLVWTFWEWEGQGNVTSIDGVDPGTAALPLPEALARAGREGWELVSTHSTTERQATYVFKRPTKG